VETSIGTHESEEQASKKKEHQDTVDKGQKHDSDADSHKTHKPKRGSDSHKGHTIAKKQDESQSEKECKEESDEGASKHKGASLSSLLPATLAENSTKRLAAAANKVHVPYYLTFAGNTWMEEKGALTPLPVFTPVLFTVKKSQRVRFTVEGFFFLTEGNRLRAHGGPVILVDKVTDVETHGVLLELNPVCQKEWNTYHQTILHEFDEDGDVVVRLAAKWIGLSPQGKYNFYVEPIK